MQDDIEHFKNGEPVVNEVIELHKFFEEWFNGNLPEDASHRFSSTMASSFRLITPRGDILQRDEIIQLIEEGYGSDRGRKIWVEDVQTRNLGNIVIATYYEMQNVDGKETSRYSTALFSFDPNLPNKCIWEHVHETWVQN